MKSILSLCSFSKITVGHGDGETYSQAPGHFMGIRYEFLPLEEALHPIYKALVTPMMFVPPLYQVVTYRLVTCSWVTLMPVFLLW